MLDVKNILDKEKMMGYYRTSDMLNLLYFFPKLSPVLDLVLVDSIEEYLDNREFFDSFMCKRVDTLKGRVPILGVEAISGSDEVLELLRQVKEKDPYGVVVLFNVSPVSTERYLRYAGISVGVDLGVGVYIDAVSKGFDGREVSKGICVHERYYIPWFDLRRVNINNFRSYQTFLINEEDYKKTRLERIEFLSSIGINNEVCLKYVPEIYQMIPDCIWLNVIKNLLKRLEKNEDILANYGFNNFAISGHTEGKEFLPWQMFDQSRYTLVRKKDYK